MCLRKILPVAAALVLTCAVPTLARAQQSAEAGTRADTPSFYNLVFRVIDLDGKKTISSRSYKTSIGVETHQSWPVTVDSRDVIPPPSGTMGSDRHIGFQVEGRSAMVVGGKLAVYLSGEMSSLPTDELSGAPAASPAIVRSNQWQAWVLVPMNSPTIVYSSDDPVSTHVFEVELTASPMSSQ
jgi:hypothetical protein